MPKSLELSLDVEVISLSPFMAMPDGPGIGEFFSDGS